MSRANSSNEVSKLDTAVYEVLIYSKPLSFEEFVDKEFPEHKSSIKRALKDFLKSEVE